MSSYNIYTVFLLLLATRLGEPRLLPATGGSRVTFYPGLDEDDDDGFSETKIVGGESASQGEFPHQVALTYDGQFFCGGSILDTTLILTAAHCVEKFDRLGIKVIAGLRNLTLYDEEHEQIRDVRHIYIHENYDNLTMVNDIALLVLESPLDYSNVVRNISLPRKYERFEGQTIVTGWGRTKYEGSVSEVLKKITVPIIPNDRCRNRYSTGKFPVTVSHLCAGDVGKDTCQGDSGGPAICRRVGLIPTLHVGAYSDWVLCGIVSFGRGCGSVGYPGVYTRVASYIDWIENMKHKIATRGKCRSDNFYCSSGALCIPRAFLCDSKPDCHGPEGIEDEQGCEQSHVGSCDRNQFRCNDGHCLNQTSVCNGWDDCAGGEDEDKCPTETKTCWEGEYQCGFQGRCIPESWKCDNFFDCDDGSDEFGCRGSTNAPNSSENEIGNFTTTTATQTQACLESQFRCDSGLCIPSIFRCDSDNDCGDDSDERSCNLREATCIPHFWRCRNGQCIYQGFKCDGDMDCADGSDEESCGGGR